MTTKNTTQRTPELSFDGCGINGPDEYRTRLATFNRDGWPAETVTKYGKLLEAAPELLAASTALVAHWDTLPDAVRREANAADIGKFITQARAAIARATGDTQTEGGKL
jgi:hypothetical protein